MLYKLLTYKIKLKFSFKFEKRPSQINKKKEMLISDNEHNVIIIDNGRNYGKIKPTRFNYYTSPQPCMFGFTLFLTIGLSLLMINWVFIGFYHKIIGSLLCLYVVYRFVSIGLSNPGLAVETVDELLQHEMIRTNQVFFTDNNNEQMAQNNTNNQQQQHSPNMIQHHEHDNKNRQHQIFPSSNSSRQQFTKFGFFHFCNLCKIPIQRQTKHCKICKTCIDGFDHHCIWIGKCIGKKNMWQFKQFLCFVFVTLIYALILSIQSSRIQKIS